MPTRRAVLRGLGGAGLAAAVSGVPASQVALGGGSKDPVFTFASLPDFFNGDVADLSDLPTWDGLLDLFPHYFHEPYYAEYANGSLDAWASEAGLSPVATERAFLSKIAAFSR